MLLRFPLFQVAMDPNIMHHKLNQMWMLTLDYQHNVYHHFVSLRCRSVRTINQCWHTYCHFITTDHGPVSTLLSSRTHTAQSSPRPRSGPPPCSPAWPGCWGSSRSPCRWRSSRRWRWCWWPASWPPAAASRGPAPRWWSGSRGCSAPAGSPWSPPPRRSCSAPCWSSFWHTVSSRASNEGYSEVLKDFTITEKAPTRAFSWLKVPTSAFTFKTLC